MYKTEPYTLNNSDLLFTGNPVICINTPCFLSKRRTFIAQSKITYMYKKWSLSFDLNKIVSSFYYKTTLHYRETKIITFLQILLVSILFYKTRKRVDPKTKTRQEVSQRFMIMASLHCWCSWYGSGSRVRQFCRSPPTSSTGSLQVVTSSSFLSLQFTVCQGLPDVAVHGGGGVLKKNQNNS